MLDFYDNFYIKHGRNLAQKLEKVLWITPNRISYFRLICHIPLFYFFYMGGTKYYMIGALFNEVLYLLDRTDGALARIRGTASQYGHWIEVIGDRIFSSMFGFFGLFVTWGVWNQTQNFYVWILLFFIVFAKYADRAILTMNMEDKSEDKVMEKLQEDNVEFKKKSIYKIASKFDTWHFQVIIICAFFYYPLQLILAIHPIIFGMIISAILSQAHWVGRMYVSLRFFIRNKMV